MRITVKDDMPALSHKTKITIALAITVLGVVAGGAFWLSDLNTRVRAIEQSIPKVDEINNRTIRLESRMEEVLRILTSKGLAQI